MNILQKGLTIIILFNDGTQTLVENVFSCNINCMGYLELYTENEERSTNILFNKKADTWVSVADKSDLIYENGKCIGWKKEIYFDEEKN